MTLTITEFARMGGNARAKSLTTAERKAIAKKAGQANKGKSKPGRKKAVVSSEGQNHDTD